jgi:hypothetical protein
MICETNEADRHTEVGCGRGARVDAKGDHDRDHGGVHGYRGRPG